MELTELEIGTKLELELLDEDGTRIEPVLVSEFEGLADGKEAVIAAPIFEGGIIPLHTDTVMNVYFAKKRGNDSQLYRFNAVVRNREVSGNLHLLRIEVRGELEKIQRRSYYRLNSSVQVQYRMVDHMNEADNEGIPFIKTFTSNISGGGICLMLEDKVEVGKMVECELFADQEKKVRVFGKVVRYERCETEGKFKYEAGIAYIRIDDNDRETVVRFIFEEQRKLRKKGLI